MYRILTVASLVALSACATKEDKNGDGIVDGLQAPNSISQVAPSTPVGTISGVVINAANVGLEGVQVVMVLGNGADATKTYKTTTNTEGAYSFKDVPGGSAAQLLFSKTGYSNARLGGAVPGNAGNFPINNGNGNAGVLTLVQLNGTFKLHVYTSQGRAAKGAKALLEVKQTAFQTVADVYGTACGNFSGSGEVDENGLLTFTGTPDVAELSRIASSTLFTVTIGALDENNDGRPDVLGTVQPYSASGLFTNPDRTIFLPDARTTAALAISATNLESFNQSFSPPYRNAVQAADTINIVFNQPITQVLDTRLVKVVQEDCATVVPVSVTQRAPNVISIAPATAWTLGSRYNIIVRATGLDSGITTDFIGYFFAIDATAPRPLGASAAFQVKKFAGNTMSGAYQPNDQLFVVFDAPITYQSGPQALTYAAFDLNNDNAVGGMLGFGEVGGPEGSGVAISMAEQTVASDPTKGTFTCKQSGYSSRWRASLVGFPSTNFIPSGTQLRVSFAKEQQSSDTYQTAWGAPVAPNCGASAPTCDVSGTIVVQ